MRPGMPFGNDFRRKLLQQVRAARGDGNLHALAGQITGDNAADSLTGTGNQRRETTKLEIHANLPFLCGYSLAGGRISPVRLPARMCSRIHHHRGIAERTPAIARLRTMHDAA
jgi:hypothetical protein